jgi:hypothetical protein
MRPRRSPGRTTPARRPPRAHGSGSCYMYCRVVASPASRWSGRLLVDFIEIFRGNRASSPHARPVPFCLSARMIPPETCDAGQGQARGASGGQARARARASCFGTSYSPDARPELVRILAEDSPKAAHELAESSKSPIIIRA